MKIRQVLASQIRERMAKKPDLDTQVKLSKAAGVTQSTVWRILEGQVGASVDVVESLAKAFGIPAIALISNNEESRFLESWSKLGAEDREKVASFMQVTIASRPSNMAATQKHWTEEQTLPPGLAAASSRASARNPTRDEQKNDRQTSTATTRKRSTS